MILRLSLVVAAAVSVSNLICVDGTGHSHHHHVIIHVPYKIHTIHHTILKHIHHHDKKGEDKYEVIGYTVGKPIEIAHMGHHHMGGGGGGGGVGGHAAHEDMGHYQQYEDHDIAGNELGHGQNWVPSYGQHDAYAGGGGGGGGDGGGGAPYLEEHPDVDAAGSVHPRAYYRHRRYRGLYR